MKVIEALLKSKLFILLLLSLQAVLIVFEGFMGGFDANPVEFLQLETGRAAVKILVVALWITPLKVLFPKSKLFSKKNTF